MMLSKLWDILIGSFCRHKWEYIRDIPVYMGRASPNYFLHISECKKCGDIKQQRVG